MDKNSNARTGNSSVSRDSKAKQAKIALGAALAALFGIVLIIILIFVQKDQVEKTSVETNFAIESLQGDIDEVDNATAELRTELENMLKQLDAMGIIIDNNKETVESINENTIRSGDNIVKSEQDIKALQNTLNDYIKKFEVSTTSTNENVKNSFNAVYNDLQEMLNTINNNNSEQNTNYKNLSTQMTKTLNDIDKFINNLSEENKKQFDDLTTQVTDFQTDLTKYLEDFNASLNENIDNALTDVTNHLDATQKDIETAKKDIQDLLNDIDANRKTDIDTKFEAIKSKLTEITNHFDATCDDLSSAINDLSVQNKGEHDDTIEKLKTAKDNIEKTNNDNKTLLETELTTSEANFKASLQTTKENISNVINNASSESASNKEEILTALSKVQENVTQSFTSVSNGKQVLSSALLTKYEELGLGDALGADDNILNGENSTFADYVYAINAIHMPQVAGDTVLPVPSNAQIEITAHFCNGSNDPADHEITFTGNGQEAVDAYTNYLNAHRLSSSMSNTQSGCFSAIKYHTHNNSCYGTKIESYEIKSGCKGFSGETWTNSEGKWRATCTTCGYEWGVGGHAGGLKCPAQKISYGQRVVPDYSKLLCTKTIDYYYIPAGHYTNGEITNIIINYN